jgi:hypothetical protein
MKTLSCMLLLSLPAAAQSTINGVDKFAHAANAGWIDCRTTAGDGLRVTSTHLTGTAYAANFGWISFGPLAGPANGHTYTQTSVTDTGVNLSPAGYLTGYAYAANIGWITFEQIHGLPRIHPLNGAFTGYAYAANLGWISLDTPSSDLATTTLSRPDTDSDGIPDDWERLHFTTLTPASATTDSDGDGQSDSAEYTAGTLPKDPTSSLRITALAHDPAYTTADITWTTVATRRYRIESSLSLNASWNASPLIDPDSGLTTQRLLGPLTTAPRRFYRAVAILPLP